MLKSLFYINPNRVKWIDIAKGLVILLVIVGHTVKFDGLTRNLIFSFHMPLFFILSGYTYRPSPNWQKFFSQLRKSLKFLLLPSILISLFVVVVLWGLSNNHDLQTFFTITKRISEAWWWGSGVKVYNHPGIGSVWFLISLFWAKSLVDFFHVILKGRNIWYVYAVLAALGVYLGKHLIWMPQNFDVTLVCMFFFFIGMQWKLYKSNIDKYKVWIIICTIGLYVYCMMKGTYIELATRNYASNILSILLAISGTYIICWLCEYIERISWINNVLLFIGSHTLTIFLVHHVDAFLEPYWRYPSIVNTILYRVSIVLVISFIYLIVKHVIVTYTRRQIGKELY